MVEKPTYGALEQWRQELEKENFEFKRLGDALENRIVTLTQPLKDKGDIPFEDLFNIDDIQRIQDEIGSAAGVTSIITRTDGTPITAPSNFCRLCKDIIRQTDKVLANCVKSDARIGRCHSRGPIIQLCMSGGIWMWGQEFRLEGNTLSTGLSARFETNSRTRTKCCICPRYRD